MLIPTVKERNADIKKAGWSNWKSYLKSKHYRIIKQHILERDSYQCRLCPSNTNEIHFIFFTRDTLRGYCPHNILTICRACQQTRLPFSERQHKIAESIFRTQVVVGRSNTKIGRWFTNQKQANKSCLKSLLEHLNE